MKTYIPVEVIEKQIAFLRDLMNECGENDYIMTAIKNLQIVNSHDNRCYDSEIYREVKREYLKDDARTYVSYYLARKRGVFSYDIPDEDLDKYDYEYLVDEYERREDCDSAFTDLWESVVWDYMSDFEDEDEEEED